MNTIIINKIWFKYLPSFILSCLILVCLLPSSPCFSLKYLEFPCTFCGGTRSFILFHQLDWIQSFLYNPLVFLSLIISWTGGVLGLLSEFNKSINKIFDRLHLYINNYFFILFGLFILLYLLQSFFRIIYY